jgi:hypothetical protein
MTLYWFEDFVEKNFKFHIFSILKIKALSQTTPLQDPRGLSYF